MLELWGHQLGLVTEKLLPGLEANYKMAALENRLCHNYLLNHMSCTLGDLPVQAELLHISSSNTLKKLHKDLVTGSQFYKAILQVMDAQAERLSLLIFKQQQFVSACLFEFY